MEPMKVRKTTFDEDLKDKEAYFLALSPLERLKINEELKKRIWGELYNTSVLEGAKVKITRF